MATFAKPVRRARKAKESSRGRLLAGSDYEAVNVEALKGILSYLKYLYTEGEISDKAYEVLVSQALSTFVQNRISLRVEKVFDEIDVTLGEVSEVLLSDILG